MANILSVLHLVKHFGDVKALDGATFFIEEGAIFGLLGPNGAGKTTTINILAQILKPDSGKIEIDGMDLFRKGSRIKKIIGYVPQDLAIYHTLNARENLRFFGGLYGLSGKELENRIEEALELVGLKDAANRRAGKYSGGMKRRLNIAAGLLNRPRLLILDEPAVGVDPQSRNHILNSIKYLNEQYNISVLYTTHYMDEVQQLCKRAAIIDYGKIIADNSISDLIEKFGSGLISIELEKSEENLMQHIPEQISRENVRIDGTMLSISDSNPHRLLPSVLENLTSNGIRVSEIEVMRSNLETVFLNLTGRSLRDE